MCVPARAKAGEAERRGIAPNKSLVATPRLQFQYMRVLHCNKHESFTHRFRHLCPNHPGAAQHAAEGERGRARPTRLARGAQTGAGIATA